MRTVHLSDTQGEPPGQNLAASVVRRSRWKWVVPVAFIVGAVIGGLGVRFGTGNDNTSADPIQTARLQAQVGSGFVADASASLERRDGGVFAEMELPVPPPGSYEYPTGDLYPPWSSAHPPVSAGASGAPEVFTGWLAAFNNPEQCTDPCDLDDVGVDTAAEGGLYQFDGRVGVGDTLVLRGGIRLGEKPSTGARLTDPARAEIHLAIAPHGRVLSGPDGWRQLNGPVGNPSFWWSAVFLSPEAD